MVRVRVRVRFRVMLVYNRLCLFLVVAMVRARGMSV